MVEEIAQILQVNGIKAIPYHAGLDAKTRAKHQDMFLMEDADVVVATIAICDSAEAGAFGRRGYCLK